MSTRPAPRPGVPVPAGDGSPSLGPGRKLGRYELLGLVAAGGMAEVWVAEQTGDLGFKKLVALKTIRPEYAFDATFRAMFLDEARHASRIRHANVVEVLDLGVDGNVVFQVMTLVEGTSLSGWIKKVAGRGLARGVALRVVIDALRGLEAAHELVDDDGAPLGLVHRDVSPQNVLVGIDGIAKLADFGIAKAFGRGAGAKETLGGEVKGKLGYVAPEIFQGLPASSQSDIFSAGVILWECLTGERLFPVESGETKRRTHVARDPREVVPDLPTRLAEIAMAALHVDPFARTASATEMADALEATGLAASHKEVALKLAADMGDAIVRGRRPSSEKPNEASRTETVAIVATVPLLNAPERPSLPPPRPSRTWWIGGAVVAALALAFGVVRIVRAPEVRPVPEAATSAAPAPPPSTTEAPRDERSAALDPLDAGAPKAASAPPPVKSGKRRGAAPPGTGVVTTPPVTSGPHPTFGSPY